MLSFSSLQMPRASDGTVHINRKCGSQVLKDLFTFIRLSLPQALIDYNCGILLLARFAHGSLQGKRNLRR